MAIYTRLTTGDVIDVLKNYHLGAYQAHEEIVQGIENTNYHVFTDRGRYILTILEKRTKAEDLPFVFNLIEHLKAKGFNVPDIYTDNAGKALVSIKGKPAMFSRFLKGSGVDPDEITETHCHELGKLMASMHLAVVDFDLTRKNPMSSGEWQRLLKNAVADTQRTAKIIADYKNLDARNLPGGAIHADLFPDNVFFSGNKFVGLIDFYFACTDCFLYDIAIAVNAWCKTLGDLKAFAQGYETHRKLTLYEKQSFGTVCRAAALRIYATRMYDWEATPVGASVVKKDPQEYMTKMQMDMKWP